MSKRIAVITCGYPSAAMPTSFPFVKELVEQWKKQGVDVQVINPLFGKSYRKCCGKAEPGVYHPRYTEYRFMKLLPALRKIQRKLRNKSFMRAVDRTLLKDQDTILYAHFLDAGYIAAKISEKYGYPAYCAYGESSLWSIKDMDIQDVSRVLQHIDGFVSVSTENKRELVAAGLTTENKVAVFPNGVDHTLFYRRDKKQCREELGLPQDKVIGIFIGHFIERKGPLRVSEATKDIENLKMIYIGAGEQVPQGNNILHCGRVLHDDIPKYLSAADFFVLPTLAEGCCNAIVEAMACGLPVISSNGAFNDDILKDSFSIRVDPTSVEEIREAIQCLCADAQRRDTMGTEAERFAQRLNVQNRAAEILTFIGEEKCSMG